MAGTYEGLDISKQLQDQIKSINRSVSGLSNQTINPIKATIADVKSGIAIIKDGERNILNQVRTYRSVVIDGINDFISSLTGGYMDLKDFGKVIDFKDGFKIDKDQLLRMSGDALGFNLNSISSLKDDLADEFLNELNDMTLGLSDGLFQTDGSKVKIAGDWDKNIGDALFDFLSNGSSEFKTVRNFAAANASLNVMMKYNAQIGFVDGFKSFKEMYPFESDYQAALVNTISILLTRGDVDSLNEVISILNTASLYTVTSKYPNFAQEVLSNFKLPENVLVEQHEQYKNMLLTIIEKVCGKYWFNKNTFMGDVLNIGLVSKISDDSKTVLEREASLIPFLCTAGLIEQSNCIDLFKKDFPNSVMI